MRTSFLTALMTTTLFASGVLAASAAAATWTYGPKGSCRVHGVPGQNGKPGYKEYRDGRPTGRCVLQ